MCQKMKASSKKNILWLKILGVSFLFILIGIISFIWFLKSDAFQTQFVSIFDKKGSVIDKFDFAGNKIFISNGKIRSKLISIRKIGFPFSPGVLMDVDIIVDASDSDQGNQSTVHIPLHGIRIDSSLFSVSSISLRMPKIVNMLFKDKVGADTLVALKNKRMVLKLIGGSEGQEFQVQALDLVIKAGEPDNNDLVSFTTLSAVFKYGVKKQHIVFDTHGVNIVLSSGKILDFSRIAYAGKISNKPDFSDPESQALVSLFQSRAGNKPLVWRKLIRMVAKDSTTGDADFNLTVSPKTYITSQLYFSPNKKNDDMEINGNIRMSDTGTILNNLFNFGIPIANIKSVMNALGLIANHSIVEGVEHLEIGVRYKDGVFSVNDKPVIILPGIVDLQP